MNDNEKSIIKQYFVGRNFPIDTVNGMQPLILEKLGLKSQKICLQFLTVFQVVSSSKSIAQVINIE